MITVYYRSINYVLECGHYFLPRDQDFKTLDYWKGKNGWCAYCESDSKVTRVAIHSHEYPDLEKARVNLPKE